MSQHNNITTRFFLLLRKNIELIMIISFYILNLKLISEVKFDINGESL